jgi:hypothetical protein
MRLGIHPRTLYALRDDAHLVRVDRALYRVADPEPFGNSDLVMWLSKFPEGIWPSRRVCPTDAKKSDGGRRSP